MKRELFRAHLPLLAAVLMFACGRSEPPAPAAATASTPSSASSAALPADVAPDLERRLARWKTVDMPFTGAGLSPRERQLVEKLIAACRPIESIFWRQADPEGLALFQSLEKASDPRSKALARLLWIHGGRYDLLDENKPFVGKDPMPPGRAFYPAGITREEIEAYVRQHPDQKKAIYDERTLVRRKDGALETIPYRIAYREFLEPAAAALREAAALADEPAFARFLNLRADALLTDDYYASDVAWVELVNPKFDLILAPYETYLDELLGVKTSYGAAVLIRNEPESTKLALFQKYVPELQEALPLPARDRPSQRGRAAPMEVMDAPFRSGDLRHGYQAVADNLPNEPRIHQEKGSKRIFFENFLDARVEYVILPVAKILMREDQAAKVSAEGYLIGTLMHEISHGLGPAYARREGKKMDIREALGTEFSALEEAKADVTGMFGLEWLMDRGALPRDRAEEFYVSYLAGLFRTARFGAGEAHGRAEMMEFNYLFEKGAIAREASGRYAIVSAKMRPALAALTRELLEIEATGDRARAEAWFDKYGEMPPDLTRALEAAASVPVDIDPKVPFPEGAR